MRRTWDVPGESLTSVKHLSSWSHRQLILARYTERSGDVTGARPCQKEEEMTEHAKMVSVGPQRRIVLPEVTWESISEPGAYLEVGTGDLYRIPAAGRIRERARQ